MKSLTTTQTIKLSDDPLARTPTFMGELRPIEMVSEARNQPQRSSVRALRSRWEVGTFWYKTGVSTLFEGKGVRGRNFFVKNSSGYIIGHLEHAWSVFLRTFYEKCLKNVTFRTISLKNQRFFGFTCIKCQFLSLFYKNFAKITFLAYFWAQKQVWGYFLAKKSTSDSLSLPPKNAVFLALTS